MGKFLKSFKWSMLVMGIISLVIGVLILVNPNTAVATIIRIVGYILIAAGIIAVLGYLFDKKKGLSSYGDIIVGVIILAIGLVLAFSPTSFINFVGYIFAAILAVHGISDMVEGFRSKKYDDPKWTHTTLMGLICIIFAAIIFWNPFRTVSSLMILVAVALIIDGLTSVLIAGRVGVLRSRYAKQQAHATDREAAEDVSYTVKTVNTSIPQAPTTPASPQREDIPQAPDASAPQQGADTADSADDTAGPADPFTLNDNTNTENN